MVFMHWMPRKHGQVRYSLSPQISVESRGAFLRIRQIRSSKVMISLAVKRENIAIVNVSVRVNGLVGKQRRPSNTHDPAFLALGIWIIIYNFGSSYGNTAQMPHLEWIYKNKKQYHHLLALKILIDLLKYTSQSIQVTVLRCTTQWLAYSQVVQSSQLSDFRPYSSPTSQKQDIH